MRFLPKDQAALAAHAGLSYTSRADRRQAVALLQSLQWGFCAYSERRLKPLDSVHIEHFNPDLKGTPQDSILNWHAVIGWMNQHKPRRIEDFLPLPDISTWSFSRVRYERGEFVCSEPDDVPTQNLIRFLGVNRPEVFAERRGHVEHLRRLQAMLGSEEFADLVSSSLDDLNFPTALEAELGLPVMDWITRPQGE